MVIEEIIFLFKNYLEKSKFMQFRLLIFFYITISFSISNAEDLKTVLRDAYNFFPDIKKSQSDLENAKKDLQISKTDFLPSIEFSASKANFSNNRRRRRRRRRCHRRHLHH